MDDKVKRIIKKHIIQGHQYSDDLLYDLQVFITWKCKVLQNYKYLLCSNLNDQKYYEVTYNGDTNEFYLDEYEKKSQTVIKEFP